MRDFSFAQKTITTDLDFLRPLGFGAPTASIEQSKLLGDSLLMIYVSASAQRQVEVSYVSANQGRAAAISVFICDTSGNRFSLEDWIEERAPTSRLRFLADGVSESEKAFLDRFCSDCRTLLEGPLRDTITGSGWDSVNIDWKGYR